MSGAAAKAPKGKDQPVADDVEMLDSGDLERGVQQLREIAEPGVDAAARQFRDKSGQVLAQRQPRRVERGALVAGERGPATHRSSERSLPRDLPALADGAGKQLGVTLPPALRE